MAIARPSPGCSAATLSLKEREANLKTIAIGNSENATFP